MNHDQPRRVAVIGAGLTGLAAAYELARASDRGRPAQAVVYEAETRVGGRIRSDSHDGVSYEAGAYALRAVRPQALELARELGLGGELVDAEEAGPPFVLAGGRLRRLPEGLRGDRRPRLLPALRSPLLTWKGKLRLLCEPAVPSLDGQADEPLAAFLERRIGPEAAAVLAEPVYESSCAGDSAVLSAASCVPGLVETEGRGGILRALMEGRRPAAGAEFDGAAASRFKRGLRVLPEALAGRLPSGALRLGAAVTRLSRRGGGWELHSARGVEFFDAVIAALPAPALADLTERLDPELTGILREIRFAGVAVVVLAYNRRDLPSLPPGPGLLVPRREGRRLALASFESNLFPSAAPSDLVLVRVLLGGEGRPGETAGDDAQAARAARAELRELLGLGEAHPRWTRVARWDRACPQFSVGHALRLRRLESCLRSFPGLFLAGDSYRGLGLSECARSGRQAARAVLERRRVSGVL